MSIGDWVEDAVPLERESWRSLIRYKDAVPLGRELWPFVCYGDTVSLGRYLEHLG